MGRRESFAKKRNKPRGVRYNSDRSVLSAHSLKLLGGEGREPSSRVVVGGSMALFFCGAEFETCCRDAHAAIISVATHYTL